MKKNSTTNYEKTKQIKKTITKQINRNEITIIINKLKQIENKWKTKQSDIREQEENCFGFGHHGFLLLKKTKEHQCSDYRTSRQDYRTHDNTQRCKSKKYT